MNLFSMTISTPIFLALGSNLGDRAANLQAAIAALPPAVTVLACSPIYETDPWGYTDQPAFLNQVIQAETQLAPLDVLAHLKDIEACLGRIPTVRYGPRLIDLDILFYGDQIFVTPELTIPHPRLHERAFVLVPLADLAPSWPHPTQGVSVATLLASVDRAGVCLYGESMSRIKDRPSAYTG
jgi:2-amino-4-hydroxy-6-hydroxymethyldihydropteridine diphosphokinase